MVATSDLNEQMDSNLCSKELLVSTRELEKQIAVVKEPQSSAASGLQSKAIATTNSDHTKVLNNY